MCSGGHHRTRARIVQNYTITSNLRACSIPSSERGRWIPGQQLKRARNWRCQVDGTNWTGERELRWDVCPAGLYLQHDMLVGDERRREVVVGGAEFGCFLGVDRALVETYQLHEAVGVRS